MRASQDLSQRTSLNLTKSKGGTLFSSKSNAGKKESKIRRLPKNRKRMMRRWYTRITTGPPRRKAMGSLGPQALLTLIWIGTSRLRRTWLVIRTISSTLTKWTTKIRLSLSSKMSERSYVKSKSRCNYRRSSLGSLWALWKIKSQRSSMKILTNL